MPNPDTHENGTYRCPRCHGEFPGSALEEDRECVWCGQALGEFEMPGPKQSILAQRKRMGQDSRVVETRVENTDESQKSGLRRLFFE